MPIQGAPGSRPHVAVTQAFLTLSEVIGHVDLLVNEGGVREGDDGEVIRYEASR